MKKKTTILIALGAVVLIAAAGITYAWFTSSADPVTNTFTAGTINIQLNDVFPASGITNIQPGDTYDKDVSVTNTGTQDAYVRIQLIPKWTPKAGSTATLDVSAVDLDLDNTNWVAGDNNWYYYKKILKPTESTSLLLSGVTFDGASIDNNYQGATFTVDAKGEAVQSSHYAFKDVWGLPGISTSLGGYIPAAGVEEWVP